MKKNIDLVQTDVVQPATVQMPMRCSADLQERIIRALGETMSRSGRKVSRNDFLIHLLELGLHQTAGKDGASED